MSIIGPRETHDYREFNLPVPGTLNPPPKKCPQKYPALTSFPFARTRALSRYLSLSLAFSLAFYLAPSSPSRALSLGFRRPCSLSLALCLSLYVPIYRSLAFSSLNLYPLSKCRVGRRCSISIFVRWLCFGRGSFGRRAVFIYLRPASASL